MPDEKRAVMTVVGFGPMGKRFTGLFAPVFEVRVCSARDVAAEAAELGATAAPDRSEAIASSDYIFLAVPLKVLAELAEEVSSTSKCGAVVIDCCSARVPAERVFAGYGRRHFGLHDVAHGTYCVTGGMDDTMKAFFHARGIRLEHVSAEEHDRINAVIGIGHFIGLSLGQFLNEDEKRILSGMGSGSKLMALVNHFVGKPSTTWGETQIDNPFTKQQRLRLIQALENYHRALSDGEYPFE